MRTIDADALFRAMEDADWFNDADRDEIAERLVLDAPTISGWLTTWDNKRKKYVTYWMQQPEPPKEMSVDG